MRRANALRWPSPRTSASAISTPSTRPTGSRAFTARTYSAPASWPPGPGGPDPCHRRGRRHAYRDISVFSRELMTGNPAEFLAAGLAEPPTAQDARADLAAGTETSLAEMLAAVMHVERVAADSNFFDDLGADSLVMAHFCARVRKQAGLPPVSMRDIYRHPTIRSLAAALADAAPAPAGPSARAPAEVAAPASTRQYVLCGVLQLVCFLGYAYIVAVVAARAYDWIAAGSGAAGIYLRSVLFGGAAFLVVCAIPILAKWVL